MRVRFRSRIAIRLSTALGVFAISAVTPACAHAQAQAKALVPSGTGFSIGGAVSFARMTSSSLALDGASTGTSGTIEVAYGASPRLSLLGVLRPMSGKANGVSYSVHGIELGIRYLGKAGQRTRPFIDGGMAIRTLGLDLAQGRKESRNVGPWASVGLIQMRNGHFSLEGALTWTKSTFDNWTENGQAAVTESVSWDAVGARVGLRYWVRAR